MKAPAMRSRLAAALASALVAAGCGGGFYLEVGDGFDRRPDVALVAGVSAAQPGQTIFLAAAASDDQGIDRVEFHRLADDGSDLLLGSDASPPYEWSAVMPSSSAAQVEFYARAFDTGGRTRSSGLLAISVLR